MTLSDMTCYQRQLIVMHYYVHRPLPQRIIYLSRSNNRGKLNRNVNFVSPVGDVGCDACGLIKNFNTGEIPVVYIAHHKTQPLLYNT